MKVDIVDIGTAKGICIPSAMLAECGFERSAELAVEGGHLVLRPAARHGWDDAYRAMAERGDDRLLDTPAPDFDAEGWEW